MRAELLLAACLALMAAPVRAEHPGAPVLWVPVVVPVWGPPWMMVPPPVPYWLVYAPGPRVPAAGLAESTAPVIAAEFSERIANPAPSGPEQGAAPSTAALSEAAAPVTPVRAKSKRKSFANAVPKLARQPRKLCWRDHELKPCP